MVEYQEILDKKFSNMGLRLNVSNDFEEMDALLQKHSNPGMPSKPNPMFSPKYNRMTSDRSFWFGLVDNDNEVVCTMAAKKFDHVEDLGAMWRELRTFYDDETKPVPADRIIVDTKFPVELEGTLSITGRGWTHPNYRRRGLVRDLAVLARSECLSRWLVDWHLGTTTAKHISAGREVSCFGYDPVNNVDRLGFYIKHVGEEATVHLHLLWMGPDEISTLAKQEVKRLRAEVNLVAAE